MAKNIVFFLSIFFYIFIEKNRTVFFKAPPPPRLGNALLYWVCGRYKPVIITLARTMRTLYLELSYWCGIFHSSASISLFSEMLMKWLLNYDCSVCEVIGYGVNDRVRYHQEFALESRDKLAGTWNQLFPYSFVMKLVTWYFVAVVVA